MKTAKSQNIPYFQRDFTEIFETVLRSENFAANHLGMVKPSLNYLHIQFLTLLGDHKIFHRPLLPNNANFCQF
jgi:hypothetical protein